MSERREVKLFGDRQLCLGKRDAVIHGMRDFDVERHLRIYLDDPHKVTVQPLVEQACDGEVRERSSARSEDRACFPDV